HQTVSGRSYPAQRYGLLRWLLNIQTRSSTESTDVVGRQGWTDRRFSGMKTASLQGRIHGVSAQPCRPSRTSRVEVGTRYKPTPLSHQGLPSGFNVATLALRSWLDSRCIASVIWRKVRAPQGRVPGNAWGV